MLTGVVDAVRLTGELDADHVRLTTRDERDAKRTELALQALASQGAAVLIAGLDPGKRRSPRALPSARSIPVILLSPLPSEGNLVEICFRARRRGQRIAAVLGESARQRVVRAWSPRWAGSAPAGRLEANFSTACLVQRPRDAGG